MEVDVTALFAPDVVILGGSIGGEHDLFAEQIAEAMAAHAAMVATSGARVRPAARPDDAGVLGAAHTAFQASAIPR